MHRTRLSLLSTALLLVSGAGIVAETRDDVREYSLQEVVEVRGLEVLLLARDADAKPVEDLTPDDLRVEWKGEPLAFSLRKAAALPEPDGPLPQVRLTMQIGSEERVAVTTPAAPRYYVFFIDLSADLRTRPNRAAEPLVEFVRETLRPHDLAAVLAYNGSLIFESEFGSKPVEIETAIRRAYANPRTPGLSTEQRIRTLISRIENCESVSSSDLVQSEEEERMERSMTFGAVDVDPACVRGLAAAYVEEGENRARAFFQALEHTIRFSAGICERITLVALTHGVSLEPDREFTEVAQGLLGVGPLNEIRATLSTGEGARDALERARTLAERENVTLYIVDPARRPTGVKSARQASFFLDAASPIRLAQSLPRGPLEELASTTVGAYVADSDAADGLRKAAALERGRYRLLVYVPDSADGDVTPTIRARRNELRITYDTGSGAASDTIPTELALGPARTLTGKPSTELYLPFTIAARRGDLGYRLVGSKRVVDLTLYIRLETGEGHHVASSYHPFRHSVPTEGWDASKNERLGLRGWIEAPPGRYRISALIRNASSGKAGRALRSLRLEAGGP